MNRKVNGIVPLQVIGYLAVMVAIRMVPAHGETIPLNFDANPVETGFNVLNPTLVNLDRDGVTNWVITKFKGNSNVQLLTTGSMDPAPPGGGSTVRLICDNRSSFAINRNVTKMGVSPAKYPLLEWTWLARTLPAGADYRAKDDQVLQVQVGLKDARNGEVKWLSYIWDTTAPQGSSKERDYGIAFTRARTRIIVVESGPANLNRWLSVKRNYLEDYKTHFGAEPTQILLVRVQANAQHTRTSSDGSITGIALASQ